MKRSEAPPRAVDAVAIGGSAGAVDALSNLLPAFQVDCGVAVFVVIHLPRQRPSLLAEIFSGKCRLPVTEAQDKQPISAGTIYFAPPDYHLLVEEGRQLALAADQLVHFSRPSIDVLFESAADVFSERLLGIVLSGANEDGAAGLRAVSAAGGLTFVQHPASAAVGLMPMAALRAAQRSSSLDLAGLAHVLSTIRGGQLPSQPIATDVS